MTRSSLTQGTCSVVIRHPGIQILTTVDDGFDGPVERVTGEPGPSNV